MKDLIIYRSDDSDILKKIKYFKRLNINTICIDIFDRVDDNLINKLINISNKLADQGLLLIVEIDIIKIIPMLIETEEFILNEPKIRKSFYQFINYLIKQGIKGFYFKELDEIYNKSISIDEFMNFIREMSKNTLRANDIVSICQLSEDDISLAKFLASKQSNNFDFINLTNPCKNNFMQIKSNIKSSQDEDNPLNQILTTDNSFKNFINTKNYPYHSLSLLAGATYMQSGSPMLSSLEEMGLYDVGAKLNDFSMMKNSNMTMDFYQRLMKIRKDFPLISHGSFRLLFDKDPDVFSFMKIGGKDKLIVFANFSQREVFLDIRFHFIDLYDYKYLLGNYGKRRIVKNLLLRPYEFVAFIK